MMETRSLCRAWRRKVPGGAQQRARLCAYGRGGRGLQGAAGGAGGGCCWWASRPVQVAVDGSKWRIRALRRLGWAEAGAGLMADGKG